MKIIKCLAEQMSEEIEDASNYAKLAVQNKDTDQRLASCYCELAKQELNHANSLHEQAVRIIGSSTEKPPEAMKAVWEWEHERYIDHVAAVKVLLDMFNK